MSEKNCHVVTNEFASFSGDELPKMSKACVYMLRSLLECRKDLQKISFCCPL
jgi:hypothetical protein